MQRSIRVFAVVAWAQTLALLGSQTASFALSIWIYKQTGLVTLNGILVGATLTPEIVFAPLAGVIVDRYDRGRVLLAGHTGAGLCTLALLVLHRHGTLTPTLAIVLVGLASLARAPQYPAFSASVSLLVPRAQLSRANGAWQLAFALVQILAPVLGGLLLPLVHLDGVFVMGLGGFGCAVLVFSLVRLPRPPVLAAAPAADGEAGALALEAGAAASEAGAVTATARGRLRDQVLFGYRWVRARPGLVQLLLVLAASNVVVCMAEIVLTPLVLGFAGERAVGVVFGCGGVGMLAGSVLTMVVGGLKPQVRGVLFGGLLQGALLLCGAARPSVTLAAVGTFGAMFAFPVMCAASETIWQRKVPPEIQGRVFAFRTFLARCVVPLASLGAGPLNDLVFEPLLRPRGAWAATVGALMGTGKGRGSGLFLASLGMLMLASVAAGWASPRLRRVEAELPDHEADAGRSRAADTATA